MTIASHSQWSDIISDDPHTVVSLSLLSDVLNEFFHLDTDDAISYDTPFVWWDRSKRGVGIAHPLPKPISYAAQKGRAPLWHQEQVIHWFAQWRGLDVPECSQAGDKVSKRGHLVLSQHRSVA